MHKTANVFPIVGGRKVDHLQGNIEALNIRLTTKDMEEIEGAHPFDAGFPISFLFMNAPINARSGEMFINQLAGQYMDTPYRPKPIEPREKEQE